MALLSVTTGKSMLSSSWSARTCFSASWWRLRSWPWVTPTAPRPKHKVFSSPPPPRAAAVPWFEEEYVPRNNSPNRNWRLVIFSIFPKFSQQQNVSWRVLFSCCIGKHLTSTSRDTKIISFCCLHFKVVIIEVFFFFFFALIPLLFSLSPQICILRVLTQTFDS